MQFPSPSSLDHDPAGTYFREDSGDVTDRPHGRDRGLSKQQRIRDSATFRAAFEQGRPVVGKYMVMRQCRAGDASLRLGVIVSKRTLRRAVDRGRAKRLLREAYRLNRFRFSGQSDVVLIARRPIAQAGIDVVERELLRLAGKGGLIK